jgi:hypothetical protein
VERAWLHLDPYLHDPERWGVSLAQMAELMIPCLDAAGARTVAEVGAFAGDLTRVLVRWATDHDAQVRAIDPAPQDDLVKLAKASWVLELDRRTSLEALPSMPLPDAIIIDGDHNYYTVTEELRLIGERAPEPRLPLLIFHDVCWPHGRRDDYFDVDLIPESARHPVVDGSGGIYPGDPAVRPDGLPYPHSAAREGGAGNGVLTAVEDFVASREKLRLVVVPAFFGMGVVWHLEAPWADRVAALLDPWDRHPVLERLEENRVRQLAERHARSAELWRMQAQLARQRRVLERLLESSAFGVAERLSRLRLRMGMATDQSAVSREAIRRALED